MSSKRRSGLAGGARGPVRGPAIRTEGLSKAYRTGLTQGMYRYRSLREDAVAGLRRRVRRGPGETERLFWALRDVSISVAQGETVGIIGRNGAGKSTLLKLLARITPPTEGRAEIRGRLGSLLEVGTGFHPELTGRDNVFLAGAVLGMSRAEIARKLDEIVAFAGIERFLDTPVKRFSSGMYLRLAFAVAAHLEPEILLVDEVLAVGDAEFQRKCLGKMAEVGAGGRTIVFVSHSMSAVLRLCPRVVLLDGGRVLADGPSNQVVRTYMESGLGTTAERSWPDRHTAPGDDVVRLHAVRVRSGGRISEEVDIRLPVEIEIEYWQLSRDPMLRPIAGLHLYNEEGALVFIAGDFTNQDWWTTPRRPGLVRAVCRIPGNLLAEGRFFVNAVVNTLEPMNVHAIENDAVAFEVVDRSQGDGARGTFTGDWPGVIRPLLDWDVTPVETGCATASNGTRGHDASGATDFWSTTGQG